jgi:GT2 family glycosyltransferase
MSETFEIRSGIVVIVASLGRAEALQHLLSRLALQTLLPDEIILSLESENDRPCDWDPTLSVRIIYGPRGSSVQRNRAIDLVGPESEIIAIVDDDYVPSPYFLQDLKAGFTAFPEASGLGGYLLADGAHNDGVQFEAAIALIDAEDTKRVPGRAPRMIKGIEGVYGCNMAFRRDHVKDIRFDEGVPLYGWLEDTDFGARLPGPFIYTDAFYGVHCAVKLGRESRGTRFGYSQVANAIFFYRKGTISAQRMRALIWKPVLANLVKSLRPEPWIDRRGRLAGNLTAFADLLRGRLSPDRIRDM